MPLDDTPATPHVVDDDSFADETQEDIGTFDPFVDGDGDGIPDDLEDDGEVSLDDLLAEVEEEDFNSDGDEA